MAGTILVVDDVRCRAALLRQELESLGCPCTVLEQAHDYRSAKRVLLAEDPDIVIADMTIPEQAGVDASEEWGRRLAHEALTQRADNSRLVVQWTGSAPGRICRGVYYFEPNRPPSQLAEVIRDWLRDGPDSDVSLPQGSDAAVFEEQSSAFAMEVHECRHTLASAFGALNASLLDLAYYSGEARDSAPEEHREGLRGMVRQSAEHDAKRARDAWQALLGKELPEGRPARDYLASAGLPADPEWEPLAKLLSLAETYKGRDWAEATPEEIEAAAAAFSGPLMGLLEEMERIVQHVDSDLGAGSPQ